MLVRRDFLKAAGATAVGTAIASTPGIEAAAAAAAEPPQTAFLDANPRWVVKPFPLHRVSITSGTVFAEKRNRVLNYATAYSVDRVLHNFRVTAGLPVPTGSSPPGGWDDANGNLRGHFSGHLLTMFAQAYAGSGSTLYLDKVNQIVAGLAQCQQAMAGRFSHPGFLSAYPETQFIQLESFATYPTIWAPYYTLHKIMRGLLDAYLLAGNTQALTVATRMGDWVHSRLSRLSRTTLNRMWAIYIAGENGAMNEIMADLYALTGNPNYLSTALAFDNRQSLFGACLANQDTITRLHANTHVPQFLGYLRVFDQNGIAEYRTVAENFYRMVVPNRMYAHGGTSGTWPAATNLPANTNPELFQPRGNIAGSIGGNGAETCTTYNLLRVARNLFFHDPNPAYMDYYERGLVNHILGSRRDADSTSSPNVTYFFPLALGSVRSFGNTGTCCGGTGVENHTKYQETIYFRAPDHSALYVNLYIGSVLQWTEKGVTVTQTTDFPRAQESTLTFSGNASFTLRLRIPQWADGFRLWINNVEQTGTKTPGTYLAVNRSWVSGDTVRVAFPFKTRTESTLDQPSVQSLRHGPLILGAISTSTTLRNFSLYASAKLDGRLALPSAGVTNQFNSNGFRLRPVYLGDTQAHHLYVRRSEPTIVFGTRSSGVPNRVSGGQSFLDAVWTGAPFANHSAFVTRVQSTSATWRSRGLLSASEQTAVLNAAQAAEPDLRP
ncbi:MAG TPA: beta-L-arabinofuranosidase domain-containing protein [Candidatus Limnocylindrales bacterium]